MKAEVPSYIIKYMSCKEPGHQDQKVNLICLNTGCNENSLICSFCSPKHKGHDYKPIKIYLDQLYSQYKTSQNKYGQHIEQLQKRKAILLNNLKLCVQKISEEFMRLQEDIQLTYENIKVQIHENQMRRSHFEQFYLSLIKDNYGDPYFEIQNYLFKDQISLLTEQDIFQPIVKSVQKEIIAVRNFFTLEKISSQLDLKVEGLQKLQKFNGGLSFSIPKNIIYDGKTFTQTSSLITDPNLGLFDVQIGQWITKVRINILQIPQGSKLTFGIMRKQQFVKANFVFNSELSCMCIDSMGKSKGAIQSVLNVISANQRIDFFVKKHNFKVHYKNSNATIYLGDKNYYFFFAMEGACKFKLTYPYVK